MRLRLWSPLPPSPTGVADYVAETLPSLARAHELVLVHPDGARVDPALGAYGELRPASDPGAGELDVYHLGNSPAHAFVYRAAREKPGVAVLHEWSLHHLVLAETVERGDLGSYLREMRRAHGETGTFVGRQVARALGGELLPAAFPLNDRILEESLAVVGLTRSLSARAAARLPGRPVLHLPHHVSLPLDPLPSAEAARAALGLPRDALVVTLPGLATRAKRLDVALRVLAGLRGAHPRLHVVVAGAVEPGLPVAEWAAPLGDAVTLTGRLSLDDFVRHLVAADVVVSLRFPSHGEISGALLRTLGVGRPVLVSAGTPSADEFPEGVVLPIDPGPHEQAELSAVLDALLRRPALRARCGALARAHVQAHHGLEATVAQLAAFLTEVRARRDEIAARLAADRPPEGLLGYFVEETRSALRELGIPGAAVGLVPRLAELCP